MIYCFKGCVSICAAPFKMCGECGKACEECFQPILNQPLGCYVVLTWLAGLVILCCGALGVVGGGCGGVKVFSVGLVIVAICHACGAYYLQRRLVTNLERSGAGPGGNRETGRQLAQEAGRMFLYDVGFCIYLIVFLCSFGYGLFCFAQLSCDECTKSGD